MQIFREGDVEPTNVTRNGPQTHGALPLNSLEQLVDLAKGQPPERQHGLLIGVSAMLGAEQGLFKIVR